VALSRGGPDNVTAVVARYQVDENPRSLKTARIFVILF
jgi:serine/threonine protein phosphatase PrpC